MKTVFNNTIATALTISERVTKNFDLQIFSNRIQKKIKKIAFAIIVFSFLLTSCKTNREVATSFPTYTEIIKPPTIVIKPISLKGIVFDNEGNAMRDVVVTFDGNQIATTNSNGTFSFTVDKNIANNYQLLLQKEGYNQTVRTYHYQMGNANYKLEMIKPCICDSIIIDNFCNCIEPIKLLWENNLVEKNKKTLNDIANCMKNEPTCSINIVYNLADANKEAAPKRVDLFRKYFIQKGISESRIHTQITPNLENASNSISIFKQN